MMTSYYFKGEVLEIIKITRWFGYDDFVAAIISPSLYISDFGLTYKIVTGFAPYNDISHDRELARKICIGLRPKIPFCIPKLITRLFMRCWDARVPYRPTFEELKKDL
ncbi:hypothetical protein Glove_198g9 [Diversispora epigaea]|uniref:Serine-threonine/tyrosine-protein kinase catalytic domain-containing protein n=1 Tax=Diversispora epigaea TaxID=1348612 RepID=A0A397IUN6_9GLOM|nr:hypothetical protein Glove_198g9 [Diversispora epigaea]